MGDSDFRGDSDSEWKQFGDSHFRCDCELNGSSLVTVIFVVIVILNESSFVIVIVILNWQCCDSDCEEKYGYTDL